MNLYPPHCNPLGYNKDFKPLLHVPTALPLTEETHHKFLSNMHINIYIYVYLYIHIYRLRETEFPYD